MKTTLESGVQDMNNFFKRNYSFSDVRHAFLISATKIGVKIDPQDNPDHQDRGILFRRVLSLVENFCNRDILSMNVEFYESGYEFIFTVAEA